MNLEFDFKECEEIQHNMTDLERKVMLDWLIKIVEGNSFFEDKSTPEMQSFSWMFEFGWACRSLLQKKLDEIEIG